MTKASGGPDGRVGSPQPVYLDSASSASLHPAAREALLTALEHGYADPRRGHGPAGTARLLLDNARAAVAEALGVRADEVHFTASGTDAVHRGLLGLRLTHPAGGAAGGGAPGTVVHTAVEHSAVLHAARWAGPTPVSVPVDSYGRVSPAAVAQAAASSGAGVVAVQAANHEVGTTQPVADVAALLDGTPVFVDACAAMGRLPLPEGWSAIAGSAHKWGGPAGVGVLVVRRSARWANPFPGEDVLDESALGFPNVAGIFAAAAALQAVVAEREETNRRQAALIDRIRTVVAQLPDIDVVGDPVDRLPHLLTFSCLYVDGEALVTRLDQAGYAVASGSACTSSSLEPSHVLAAMGVLTHGNVRLSLGRDTDEAAVDGFLSVLPGVVASLRAEVGR